MLLQIIPHYKAYAAQIPAILQRTIKLFISKKYKTFDKCIDRRVRCDEHSRIIVQHQLIAVPVAIGMQTAQSPIYQGLPFHQ